MIFSNEQVFFWNQIQPMWFFLIVFRVGAAVALLPAFGEQVVPARVKLSAVLAFSTLTAPIVLSEALTDPSHSSFLSMVGPEIVAGLTIGFLFRVLVFALQIAGSIAAQATSLSQFFGGGLGADPQPAFSTLLVVAGLCLAVMLGLHIRVIELFLISYDLFPIGRWPSGGAVVEWGVQKSAYAFSLGFTLAGPFVVASLIYNLGLGVINRAMPQLMVALVGAPAISFGGLIILFATSPVILVVWGGIFNQISTPSGTGF